MTVLPNCYRRKEREGFTLIELLVALGLSSIVLLAIGTGFSISNRSYVAQDQIAYTEQSLRSALEIMGFELRIAGYIPLDNLENGDNEITTDVSGFDWSDGTLDRIEYAATNAVAFVADLNPDDDSGTTDYAETVLYSLAGTTLTRQSWQWNSTGSSWVPDTDDPVVLAENITQMDLQYTFSDGTTGIPDDTDTDHDREAVRAVTITITAESSREVQMDEKNEAKIIQRTLQNVVMIRNMELDPTVSARY
jgi:type IV pilus assembly protein PilW